MPYVAPSARSAGEFIDESDWNQDVVDNQNAAFPLGVAAWTSYTPTLTQGATITKTVTYARYTKVGRLVTFAVDLACTSAGTAGNVIRIGLPVTAATVDVNVGTGIVYDASVPTLFNGNAYLITTSAVAMWPMSTDGAATGLGGLVFTAAIASGDIVRVSGTYEAAS